MSDAPPMSNRVRSNANLRPFQKGNTASKGKGRPKDLARLGDLFTTELVQRVHVTLAGKVVKKSVGRDFGGMVKQAINKGGTATRIALQFGCIAGGSTSIHPTARG